MSNSVTALVGMVVLFIAALIGLSALLAWPVQLLWNGCLVGAVNGINSIGFLQAWGLMILTGFLFKSYSASSK